jgi:hypothetical protein
MIGFLSILTVGFFLGMRHATDPDHVIAVTTIVSNQRTSMRAALIGALGGVGHRSRPDTQELSEFAHHTIQACALDGLPDPSDG